MFCLKLSINGKIKIVYCMILDTVETFYKPITYHTLSFAYNYGDHNS